MAFLTINGLNVDAFIEDFQRDAADLQTFDRMASLSFGGAVYATKREWTFKTPFDLKESTVMSLRDWIKGRGHYWTFQRVDGATTRFNRYSADGGPGFDTDAVAGTTRFTSTGVWGMHVGASDAATAVAGFGSEGRYSVSLFKKMTTATWRMCTAVYDGSTLTYYAGLTGTAVTTAFAWMSLSASSGTLSVTLQGLTDAGASAVAPYDKVWVVPYALTTAMMAARLARAHTAQFEPAFPYVEMAGTHMEDLNGIAVKGFVESDVAVPVTGGIARQLAIKLVEK